MTRRDLAWILVLTVLFEATAVVLRFGFGFQATRDTSAVGAYTFGLRIHHGYIGLLLLLVTLLPGLLPGQRVAGRRVGWALVVSDLVHHFLVLWPLTGDPHFDLVYPC